jgi:3-deoxy-D-manno-octulosonate 8-phosphate phosphatase (KDO 8-P phosphatase)
MVKQRALDLGINDVIQGREDKLVALRELADQHGLSLDAVAYMGDDLPDLSAVSSAGLGACPADAADEVKSAANWVASSHGGHGAVREFVEALLTAQGKWRQVIEPYS